ncbi:LacI family transcriptional regulator [Dictyobacter alpinus]|uniref:LacI family transcriptional regulator n=1 Tax=Dictyobacter alpinus TaxID=2014873 RepID=A0A402BFP8_9CHLR|nr:LacI family DNA-binding transcriptional regulator [Dictyobacter alpinus]GCE30215.1 LacI family transcriptional regulator [Dictyobacter alpinus]
MATIYDVARLAKVSKTTVSKVVSNTPYVSEETKKRVLEAMEQLQYSPNLAARGLKGKRTYVIGLIVPYHAEHLFHDPFILDIVLGVESTASDYDYSVLLFMPKPTDKRGVYDRFLRTGYVDGVVTLESHAGGIDDTILDELGIPRVSAGYREDLKQINSVHSNDRLGGYLALAHLLELGHRNIGIISGPANFVVAVDERLQGAREAMAEWGIQLDPALIGYGDFNVGSGYQVAQQLLEREQRPSALFCMNDRMAAGAMYYAHNHDLLIPADLSLIGFDDIALPTIVEPPLTTIHQSPTEIGKTATQHLFALINAEIESFATITLPVELVVRQTTAAPYARSIHMGSSLK